MRIMAVFGISHKELQEATWIVNTVLVNPNQKKKPHMGQNLKCCMQYFHFSCLSEQYKHQWSNGAGLELREKGKKHSKISQNKKKVAFGVFWWIFPGLLKNQDLLELYYSLQEEQKYCLTASSGHIKLRQALINQKAAGMCINVSLWVWWHVAKWCLQYRSTGTSGRNNDLLLLLLRHSWSMSMEEG